MISFEGKQINFFFTGLKAVAPAFNEAVITSASLPEEDRETSHDISSVGATLHECTDSLDAGCGEIGGVEQIHDGIFLVFNLNCVKWCDEAVIFCSIVFCQPLILLFINPKNMSVTC